MHFQVIIMVRLAPSPGSGNSKKGAKAGYVKTFGVNARNFRDAVSFSEDRFSSAHTQQTEKSDFIVQMQIDLVEKSDWPQEIVDISKDMDSVGIYYESGLAYFSDDDT